MSNFTDNLREVLLKNIKGAKSASGNKEVVCRCNKCMDSADIHKKHMYIGLGDENKPPMYHCFLCGSSGIVDGKFLRSYGIYDPEITSDLNSKVSSIVNKPGSRIFNNNTKVFLNTFCNRDSQISRIKLDYICNRIGINFNYNDLNNLKIVLNLADLLNINNINEYTRYQNVMEDINTNFIGFISEDNCFINMRNINITGNSFIKSRYMNYNIFNKLDNTHRYYIIPNNIDITLPINIYITEGPFDALSVRYNVIKNIFNSIYISAGGRGYLPAIRYTIEQLGIISANINLYVDNDVDNYTIFNIINYLRPFIGININLYRNTFSNEKDFGVPSNRIITTKIISR